MLLNLNKGFYKKILQVVTMEMSLKQPTSKKIKSRAPPPPALPTSTPRMETMSSSEAEGMAHQNSEESKENLLHRKVDLMICLPDGQKKPVTVDGNKAVMDFLVDLCSQHHLNPAQHTLEVRSGVSQQPLTLRPNTLIGTLDVETIFLKEKVTEVKVRKPPPKVPEKTVRLVVNFLGTQKAVVRVNPAVPLRNILPVVCEKCDLNHENVTLLKDVISKEELDMSRSLNDLGIKELYAWSSKQEKNRNLSSNSDTTEKEKRGILGFFRSYKKGNKNEGSIGNVDSDDYEEVFRTAPTSGNRYEGFSTAPSSPSVNSRSIALGASLSLSNISGIGSGTEKKRRAPPPPRPAAPIVAVEKTPENMSTEPLYATVQKEQQKKKRRAPPPPTPQMPNENHEDLENRKSSTGEKRLIRCSSVSSEEVLTTDDAGSVNSYTEDSGIVSSPSDSASLDLQNYKERRDKAENQVNESTENMQPTRAESFNSEDSWSLNTSSIRAEDEVALVKNGDEENFIAAQFQKTLAELDEDSEDLDDGDNGESNHIGTRSSPVGEESSHYNDSSEHAAVPVTIIDDVPEMKTLKYNPHKIAPVKEYNKIEQSSAVGNRQSTSLLPEVEKTEKKTSIVYKTHQSVLPEGKSKVENFKHVENQSTSDKSINNYSINTSQKQQTVKQNQSANIVVPAPFIKVSQDTRPDASKNVHKTTESTKPVLWRQQTYEPKVGMTTFTVVPPKPDIKKYDREVSLSASAIKIDDQGNLIGPQSSFDKKNVKDTFINEADGPLVEKPLLEKAKEFWRSSSMESQAVESKEQTVKKVDPIKSYQLNQPPENKVNATSFRGLIQQIPSNKVNDNQMPLTKSAPKSAAPQKKMIIIENTSKGRTEVSFAKPTVHSKFNEIQQTKAEKDPNANMIIIESTIKGKTNLQTAVNDRPNGLQQTKPVQLATASQERVIISEQPIKERKDLPFLKSSKRTSSQYVASAIFRYTEPVNKKSVQSTEAKLDTNCDKGNNTSKNNGNSVEEEPKEVKAVSKQEISVDLKKNFSNSNGQLINRNLNMEPTTKINSDFRQFIAVKKENSLPEQNGFNGSQSNLGTATVTKRTNINSPATADSSRVFQPASGLPSNAFLKAVREKSVKIEQANSIVPIKAAPAAVVTTEKEEKYDIDIIPSTIIDEPDSPSSSNVFGPKARFRPVVQKPMHKDGSLHSALMGAIQSGECKEKLRKIQSSSIDGDESKIAEPENERSALLSAIRDHNGISRLKKVSSAASDELKTLRSKEMLQKDNEYVTTKTSIPPPPFSPPPPPPPVLNAAPKSAQIHLNSSVDTRDALLEAIRSGAGASRLKKVSASVRTL